MPHPLRDGTAVKDRRLDRLVEFDERSRKFPIRAVLPKATPLKSRTWPLRIRLDQGQQGACVLFGWTHEACAVPVPAFRLGSTKTKVDVATSMATFFARERYFYAQQNDEWPGGEYPGADPQYGGTSVLAGAKAMVAAGYLGEYRWSFSIDDLLDSLSHVGPSVTGTWWLSGMWDTQPNGLVAIEGSADGGHGYVLRGVAVPREGKATVTLGGRRRVTIKTDVPLILATNSWGSGWGVGGDFLMRADEYEAKLMKAEGEVCVPVSRLRRD